MEHLSKTKELSVYIHIPFCKAKCAYCDFLSFPQSDAFFESYFEALSEEISIAAYKYEGYIVKTIFLGGGTPSIVPSLYIVGIVDLIFKLYQVHNEAEITIEANPESADYDKLQVYKECGINRISFGVQSFDNRLLDRIGRIHNIEKFILNYGNARRAGFKNINLDIMFGLPEQSYDDFVNTAQSAAELNPEHISCYGLILEEGTRLYNEKDLILANEDEEFRMFSFAKEYLESRGYRQYEISNYSKQSFASKHNLAYWTDKSYAGFGLGAHSYIDNKRFHNTDILEDYINKDFLPKDIKCLTLNDRYAEYMFLGLRKTAGISETDFLDTFGVSVYDIYADVVDKHKKSGLLEAKNGTIYISEEGIYLSNIVFSDFLI